MAMMAITTSSSINVKPVRRSWFTGVSFVYAEADRDAEVCAVGGSD
jgi:hypothetical protein